MLKFVLPYFWLSYSLQCNAIWNISTKPCQCWSTDYWADDTVWE